MSNVLVIFQSKYGQTAKIAEHVADLARKRGHSAQALPIELASARGIHDPDSEEHDKFVIVAPVYFGRHPRAIQSFVRRHADRLSSPRKTCAFVSVSGSAADPRPDAQMRIHRYVDRFLKTTGLRPNVFITAAGSVAYPRYGLLVRAMMWLIHRADAKDRTKIHELTNWATLDHVMATFLGSAVPLSRETSAIHGPAHCEEQHRLSADQSGVHRVHQVPRGPATIAQG